MSGGSSPIFLEDEFEEVSLEPDHCKNKFKYFQKTNNYYKIINLFRNYMKIKVRIEIYIVLHTI